MTPISEHDRRTAEKLAERFGPHDPPYPMQSPFSTPMPGPMDDHYEYLREIEDILVWLVDPPSWTDAGGPGSHWVVGDHLVVQQSDRNQREIVRVLQALGQGEGRSSEAATSESEAAWRVFDTTAIWGEVLSRSPGGWDIEGTAHSISWEIDREVETLLAQHPGAGESPRDRFRTAPGRIIVRGTEHQLEYVASWIQDTMRNDATLDRLAGADPSYDE